MVTQNGKIGQAVRDGKLITNLVKVNYTNVYTHPNLDGKTRNK